MRGTKCSLKAVRDINTGHSSTVAAEISLVNWLHSTLLRRLLANIHVTAIFLLYPSTDTYCIETLFLSLLSLEK